MSADNPPWLQLQRPVAPTPGLLHTLRTRGRAQTCALMSATAHAAAHTTRRESPWIMVIMTNDEVEALQW